MSKDGLPIDQLLRPHADRRQHGESAVVELLRHHHLLSGLVLEFGSVAYVATKRKGVCRRNAKAAIDEFLVSKNTAVAFI